jgi:hypothetical protein
MQTESERGGPPHADDAVTEAQLLDVLQSVPRGTLLLCGFGVSTLLLAWLAVYVFLFMARGFVG